MISPALIGGLLLVLGAIYMYNGKAMYSILIYFLADIMWAIMAWRTEDILGFIVVCIGMILGLGVFLKMHLGLFVKELDKEKTEETEHGPYKIKK